MYDVLAAVLTVILLCVLARHFLARVHQRFVSVRPPEKPEPADLPPPADPELRELAEREYRLGVEALASGLPEAARTCFEVALVFDPAHDCAWQALQYLNAERTPELGGK